jgi:hypothetical protein
MAFNLLPNDFQAWIRSSGNTPEDFNGLTPLEKGQMRQQFDQSRGGGFLCLSLSLSLSLSLL